LVETGSFRLRGKDGARVAVDAGIRDTVHPFQLSCDDWPALSDAIGLSAVAGSAQPIPHFTLLPSLDGHPLDPLIVDAVEWMPAACAAARIAASSTGAWPHIAQADPTLGHSVSDF